MRILALLLAVLLVGYSKLVNASESRLQCRFVISSTASVVISPLHSQEFTGRDIERLKRTRNDLYHLYQKPMLDSLEYSNLFILLSNALKSELSFPDLRYSAHTEALKELADLSDKLSSKVITQTSVATLYEAIEAIQEQYKIFQSDSGPTIPRHSIINEAFENIVARAEHDLPLYTRMLKEEAVLLDKLQSLIDNLAGQGYLRSLRKDLLSNGGQATVSVSRTGYQLSSENSNFIYLLGFENQDLIIEQIRRPNSAR